MSDTASRACMYYNAVYMLMHNAAFELPLCLLETEGDVIFMQLLPSHDACCMIFTWRFCHTLCVAKNSRALLYKIDNVKVLSHVLQRLYTVYTVLKLVVVHDACHIYACREHVLPMKFQFTCC